MSAHGAPHAQDVKIAKRKFLYQAAAGATVILLLVALCGSLLVLYLQGTDLHRLAASNTATSKLVAECTTPPELRHPPVVIDPSRAAQDCYLRSRQSSSSTIETLNKVTIAAAACGAAHPGNVAETRKCVEATLANK